MDDYSDHGALGNVVRVEIVRGTHNRNPQVLANPDTTFTHTTPSKAIYN